MLSARGAQPGTADPSCPELDRTHETGAVAPLAGFVDRALKDAPLNHDTHLDLLCTQALGALPAPVTAARRAGHAAFPDAVAAGRPAGSLAVDADFEARGLAVDTLAQVRA